MQSVLDPTDNAGQDISISLEQANKIGLALLPAIVVVTLLPFGVIWGWDALKQGVVTTFVSWYLLPGFVVAVVTHEALHAVGFLLFGRVPPGSIHFGIHRQTLSPYAGCKQPVSAAAYRGAVLLPAIILGVLPLLLGLASGVGWLAVVGFAMLVAAGGDMAAFWVIRGIPSGAWVIDHPERVGCRVLPGESGGVVPAHS